MEFVEDFFLNVEFKTLLDELDRWAKDEYHHSNSSNTISSEISKASEYGK
jgi:hypothetical protein